MKRFLCAISSFAALATLLSACGGGADVTPAPLPVAHVSATQIPCPYEGADFLIGETNRSVVCFFVQSDGNVTLTQIPVAMTGDVNDRYLSNVNLVTLTEKGWNDASGLTGFKAGQLILKTSVTMTAGKAIAMQVRADAMYQYDGAPPDVRVGLKLGKFFVEYDKTTFSSTETPTGFAVLPMQFRQVQPLQFSQVYSDHGYFAGDQFILSVTKVTNSERVPSTVKATYVSLLGNFTNVPVFVANCFKDLVVTYLDEQGSLLSTSTHDVAEENFLGGNVTLLAGHSMYAQVSSTTAVCGTLEVGAYLNIFLQMQTTYDGFAKPADWSWGAPTRIDIPVAYPGD